MTEDEELRVNSRRLSHRIGAWGTLNAVRQNLALGRAEILRRNPAAAKDDATLAMLEEAPFGSSIVNVTEAAQPAALSTAAKVVGAGMLAALAGTAGWMLNDQAPPPPADAVLEWEISDAGGSGSGATGIGASVGYSEVETTTVGSGDP